MGKVTLLGGALDDYAEAYAWYRRLSRRTGQRFEEAIQKALGLVGAAPESWPRIDDAYRHLILRQFPFAIIYRIRDGDVVVVAIAHGKRREDYWRSRVD